MPLIKKIIKNDTREVIVKWTGSGTDTLLLSTLISTNQTLTGSVNPGAVILGVSVSSTGATTLTRNSQVTLQIADSFEFQTDGVIQTVLDENSTSDIVVSLMNLGTLILRVKKIQGYSGV